MHSAAIAPRTELIYRHALIVRITHWVNALCLLVLLMSGLQIFNAATSGTPGSERRLSPSRRASGTPS
jgi:Ni,Fe-hydrogenase I cytochrome b subunit